MGTPHKHRDVIIAWANGADIQFFDVDGWYDCHEDGPRWNLDHQYRVKPKTVKREAWVNVYTTEECYAYATKEKADTWGSERRKACIRIEWEEEA